MRIRGTEQILAGTVTTTELNTTGVTATTYANPASVTVGADGRVTAITAGTGTNFSPPETPTGSINGSNVTYTLAHTPVSNSEQLFLNGILQKSGTDYTLSTNTITMTTAPVTGDGLIAYYRY